MFFGAFALILIGMTIGGDGHQAASIISHIVKPLFGHPVLAAVAVIGTLLGCWIGRERAIARVGAAEAREIRQEIRRRRLATTDLVGTPGLEPGPFACQAGAHAR